MKNEIALQLHQITKTFGSVVANDRVNLTVEKGEILALLGENGSGKTTLMNMIAGIYFPDSGMIEVDGHPVTIRSPKDAFALGIGMIHQHFKLVDVFNATENVMLGLKEKRFSKRETAAKIRAICEKYGFELDPWQKVYNMSVSQKQTLEIIKVLYRGANILILDEPTAVLTPQEANKLFAVLRKMRADGKSIIIITHKLQEVLSLSDRVAVLRRGTDVGTVETQDASEISLTEMMVGAKVKLDIARSLPQSPAPRIEVEHLTCYNKYGLPALRDVSFTINSGEILGIAGIAGSGQKELLEAIAGLQSCSGDSRILYHNPKTDTDQELVGKNALQIKNLGVSLAFVPEDRLGMGLVGSMGMTGNMMLRSYRHGKGLFIDTRLPRTQAEEIQARLEVVTPNINTPVRKLSGGNVQKVLVGREIAANPTVLMTAYAVRGLDINTSLTIYRLLNEQKEQGVAVVYVGEDLDVLMELCDRILVLCGGRVSGTVDGRRCTKEQLGMLMTGMAKEDTHEENIG